MRKIHILHILFFSMIIVASAYNDSGMFRDGFKLNPNGNDINLYNRSVWNGSFNGSFIGVPSDNSKVNKSGDNMTGSLKVNFSQNGTFSGWEIFGSTGQTPFYVAKENQTYRTEITASGLQIWKIRLSESGGRAEAGYLAYATPSNYIGISFYNATLTNRSDVRSTALGLEFTSQTSGGGQANPDIYIPRGQQTFVIMGLSGSGNAYSCVDSTGKLYRGSPTC